LSKVNAIRKKALEHVRNQNWPSAIKEYTRLTDLDQSNPNVFNELGDIYLKTGNKNDAYDAFSRAIDSYTRVSLHNNAVAVCKKVLRLIPARYEVLTKLGLIRKKQGLGKEAESYYTSYLDQLIVDQSVDQAEVTTRCAEVAEEMADSSPVLAKVYDCMVKFNLKDESGDVLQKLHAAYDKSGDVAGREQTQQLMQELGVAAPGRPAKETVKEGVVITEENIWSAAHTEGERMGVDEVERQTQEPQTMGDSESRPDSVYEYGEVEMGATGSESVPQEPATSTQTMPEPGGGAEAEAPEEDEPVYDVTPGAEAEASQEPEPVPEPEVPAQPTAPEDTDPAPPAGETGTDYTAADTAPRGKESGLSGNVHVSAIIGEENADGGEMTEEDHRSHYDLGMAYLEMDLMAEAIREFQMASKSATYQSRALEMIGLCFLKQNQPNLAIKQLTKGLQLIGNGETEALGIKYNLGLAYEMAGDVEKALSEFEDVYVEDVTFRDVAEKIQKYS
jgi:tetratricopeptide (TPR) repeat protein